MGRNRMVKKSLAEWLSWQEGLHPAEIDLGLERIREMVARLPIVPPRGRVVTLAGTNGKGSTSAVIATGLLAAGHKVGLYTSPHLIRYNERITIDGQIVTDAELVSAFEQIEAVRGDIPLTYFEYGTLAAWLVFGALDCDAWVQEIGLGGRLDAVNAIDADVAVITTIGFDHQEWLGESIEAIAAEKAGIMRTNCPVLFGDTPVPASIRSHAKSIGAHLSCLTEDFSFAVGAATWEWRGAKARLVDLPLPEPGIAAQFRNVALALAALEKVDPALPGLLANSGQLSASLALPGRLQVHHDAENDLEWIFDVAHNEQAMRVLVDALDKKMPKPTTIVLGMLGDKNVGDVIAVLAPRADQWILAGLEPPRGLEAQQLATFLVPEMANFATAEDPVLACQLAQERTLPGGRIVVCGSFRVVGPAMESLGLY